MKNKCASILIGLACLWLIAGKAMLAAALPEPDKITKEELLPLLGKQDLTLIDLRLPQEWNASSTKLKSAVREDPMKPGQWLDKYPKDKMLVLYCD
ncbi:MAG TPA: hypothetical protein VMT71_12695 [Syntrophorhabdales bacterium]|nr:hypothetical protein [Syntrophorhabdales bacterium]